VKILLVIMSLFFSLNSLAQNSCGPSLFGGPDVFPWSQAQPFPWTKIQGIWKVQGQDDLVIKMRVIRQTSRLKQLEIEIFAKAESCVDPKLKGIGLITFYEKNVVRFNIDNKLLKLAVFNSVDLEMNPEQCGQQVIAVSMIDLDAIRTGQSGSSSNLNYGSTNMVLKKVTSSLDLYCKKRN
jgi:hypothetical protein